MNILPNATRILCFGDSNTWGYIPASGKRYPVGVRWTSLLQEKLGNDFEIIEEGLNSRATDIDDPKHIGKNGLTYFRPCLETHHPIDLIILMLGTNDMKERFNRTPERITKGVENLLLSVKEFIEEEETIMPKIVVVSPPLVDEEVEGVKEKYLGAGEKSKHLGSLYEVIAKKYNCEFIDIAKLVSPSKKDGYHLEPEDHKKIADYFYGLILEAEL
ncbi:SGNH/GDSL hydrolase family protein [Candidatus Woesebacteria bacterium]|nr:MAG: SGNH/GDSL hydrolase family protein [Candidatus Woesebacteria bacterium]